MKIGIITIHHTQNFGGCLQAIALQEVLSNRYNAEVSLIDYCPPVIMDIYSGFSIPKYKRMVKRGQGQVLPRVLGSDIYHFRGNRIIAKRFKTFHQKYYQLTTPHVTEYQDLKNLKFDVDCLITGSDQVWNGVLFHGLDPAYFLKFGNPGCKRVAYAASVGQDVLNENELEKYKELLADYQAISTREKKAKEMLQPYTRLDIAYVLDPTLLMSANDWLKLFSVGILIPDQPYIFLYTINWSEKVMAFTAKLSKETGVPVVSVLANKKFENELGHHPNCTPDDFVRLISGAKYVVTNSFHGTVFSILFAKQFWTFLNNDRNSRMIDITTSLGISHRLIQLDQEAEVNCNSVSYSRTLERLEAIKSESLQFLDSALM